MALYMYKFNYSPETWKTLTKEPEDRRIAVSKLLEKLGGKLLHLFYAFDDFDGILVFEAPDNMAAQTAMIAIFSPGHINSMRPTQLFTVEEMMGGMRQAKGLEFRSVPFINPEIPI